MRYRSQHPYSIKEKQDRYAAVGAVKQEAVALLLGKHSVKEMTSLPLPADLLIRTEMDLYWEKGPER